MWDLSNFYDRLAASVERCLSDEEKGQFRNTSGDPMGPVLALDVN